MSRRAELEAHEFAAVTPLPVLAAWLRETLSPRVAAYLAGVSDTAVTRAWADGTEPVPADVEERLRDAAWTVWLLTDAYGEATAQVWMQSADPSLDGRSPASVLRDGTTDERRRVIESARRFVVQ